MIEGFEWVKDNMFAGVVEDSQLKRNALFVSPQRYLQVGKDLL